MNQQTIFIGDIHPTPLGEVWAAISSSGLIRLDFGISRTSFERDVRKQTKSEIEYAPQQVNNILNQAKAYLMGAREEFDFRIDWSILASDFQRNALKKVYAIPYGETRTYAEIAAQLGHPQAFRAMGRANATNPMPLVIPCHRVIGTDGKLHGYGGKGGLKTKAWLLKMEKGNC